MSPVDRIQDDTLQAPLVARYQSDFERKSKYFCNNSFIPNGRRKSIPNDRRMTKNEDDKTKFAIVMALVTLVLMSFLALLSPYVYHRNEGNIIHPTVETRRLESSGNFNGGQFGRNLSKRQQQNQEGVSATEDYGSYSCNYIYEVTPVTGSTEQCTFAKTCNGGDGVWAPFVFCSPKLKVLWLILLSPIIIVWLVLLFRLLGSTAEDYFSPALEMFSVKCKLPPRFAGVTLLALGNGAADVSATVAAITSDPELGYQLSLGALTGAAMFISGVISAAVILAASNADGSGGLQCRGAFTRDVIALLITVGTVWSQLQSGTIQPESITAFLTLYCVFVCTVLVADVYHRAVVEPRLAQCAIDQERNRQQLEAQRIAATAEGALQQSAPDQLSDQHIQQDQSPLPHVGLASKVLLALSNYDDPAVTGKLATASAAMLSTDGSIRPTAALDDPSQAGWGIESETLATAKGSNEQPIVLHGAKGLLNHHGQGHGLHPHSIPVAPGGGNDDDENGNEYSILSDAGDNLCVDSSATAALSNYHILLADSWREVLDDGLFELKQHASSIWSDIIESEDLHVVQKVLLIFELPFTICRQLTVPIPCDGFYVRSVTASALTLSPMWFVYYLHNSHGYNILRNHPMVYIGIQFMALLSALFVARYGPPTHVDGLCPMSLYISVPIALYGFVIAATWIDTIADSLVGLLNFIGIVLYIPGPVIGLTVLAWGNSMGDLSANITMARKGLANMAITACFAGPVFNILVGLGLGFSSLAAKTGNSSVAVHVSSSVSTGFIFLIVNAFCILYTGIIYGKGFIPFQYGYVALLIYSVYVITSISLQYTKEDEDNHQ
jgi:solute carrier family 24 (sodium/potassium/calcium exchanger), member 6